MPPMKLFIVGAGNRGTQYAHYAQHHPERARIVGVAEPPMTIVVRLWRSMNYSSGKEKFRKALRKKLTQSKISVETVCTSGVLVKKCHAKGIWIGCKGNTV